MDFSQLFQTLDTAKLWAIANRLASTQTVTDVHEFVAAVDSAHKIFVGAILRIVGYAENDNTDDTTRALLNPQQTAIADAIERALEEYQA